MAAFSIEFVGQVDPEDYEGNPHLLGRLRFGDGEYDFTSFHSPLEVWTREDYETHWRDGLSRAVSGRPAVLVTAMYEGVIFMMFEFVPGDANEIRIYECYPLPDDPSVNPLPEDLHSLATDPGDAYFERVPTADVATSLSRMR